MQEIWKDIPTFDGIYQASNLGRIRSLKFNKEKILSQRINRSGYYQLALHYNKQQKTHSTHKLIAMAFLCHNPKESKLVVDHINDLKTDNRIENLQLVTQRFNVCKTQGRYSSKYKGVHWDYQRLKWRSGIFVNGKLKSLGRFDCELKAHLAYQNKLKEIENETI